MSAAASPAIGSKLTAREALAAWRTFDAYIDGAAERWSVPARRILTAEGKRAAAGYLEGGEVAALLAPDLSEWVGYLNRLWLAVVPDGGRLAVPMVPQKAVDELGAELAAAALIWLRGNAERVAADMVSTSLRVISLQVTLGVGARESREETAARIRDKYVAVSPARAAVIARTQAHAAANYGSLTTAQAAPVPVRKIWLSTPDGRTRDAHRAAQGQRRDMPVAFTVMGESLMYPGDSALGASAENTANCRCSMGYERAAQGPLRPMSPARARRRRAA